MLPPNMTREAIAELCVEGIVRTNPQFREALLVDLARYCTLELAADHPVMDADLVGILRGDSRFEFENPNHPTKVRLK